MTKTITKFFFNNAQYRLGDDQGNLVQLDIDYRDQEYIVADLTVGQNIDGFKQKVVVVAQKLITKKHEVNFSSRIEL